MPTQKSKKRKFVADGVFFAELNEGANEGARRGWILGRGGSGHAHAHRDHQDPERSRACYGVLRFVMESGAKGCEVIVSGMLRAQRAKSMKFKDGYMISAGHPVEEYIDSAVRHVLLRQGVLGMKVKIMLDWDPKGKQGPKTPLPDLVTIHTPKDEEELIMRPLSIAVEI